MILSEFENRLIRGLFSFVALMFFVNEVYEV